MTLIVVVVVVLALVGALAARAGRWRRDRRSNYGDAMNRLRELAHRYGVDEDGGLPIVHSVPQEPSERPSSEGISPHEPVGRPLHTPRGHGHAEPSSPVAGPISDPGPSESSPSTYSVPVPHVEVPIPMYRDEVAPTPDQRGELDTQEGLRRLRGVSWASAPGFVHEAARVVGAFDDFDAREPGVEANARLTANTGLLLIVLFFFEGLTIPVVGRFLTWHIAIGLALIPPVLLKIGSTLWRFGHYYWGDRRFVAAGPPHPMLRVLGPVVVISTVAVIASGVALWLVGPQGRLLLRVHQLTFVLWFIVVAVHLVAHLWRATRLAAADRRDVRIGASGLSGARGRRLVVAMSLVVGVVIGLAGITVTTGWSHRSANVSRPTTVLHPSTGKLPSRTP